MGNTNVNTDANKNTIENYAAATNQMEALLPGACGGDAGITLPKGSYTIDGEGNLTIHGGRTTSDKKAGGVPIPLFPDLSYEEFMEKTGSCSGERGMGSCEDPFGMDFSAFGADPEKMVRECAGTVYGYARVSTDHQDYQRQIDALLKLGIREEDIFKDKKSGKDFNREEFQKLMLALQPGDCIVVVELDRFGRSMNEIRNHWFWITQQKQADIIVLDQPVLNTRPGMHGLGNFLAELILAIFSLMAEIERALINKRMEAGIRRARLAGKKLGRKLLEIPPLFWKLKGKFLGGLISQNMASQELGVDPKTFRSWMERTGEASDAQEWETLRAGIEEQEREERIRQARVEYGETEAEPEVNAGCAGVAAGQGLPTGDGRTDVDDGAGCVRQTMGKSYGGAEEGADFGAAGNLVRADDGAVGKAGNLVRADDGAVGKAGNLVRASGRGVGKADRRDNRKDKLRKPPGKAREKNVLAQNLCPESCRM